MERRQKVYTIDNDTLHVDFTYDEACRVWIGDYPYFEEEPRRTPTGRRWRNVTHDSCPHADGPYGDCGSCTHLVRHEPGDLIGVCFHEALRDADAIL